MHQMKQLFFIKGFEMALLLSQDAQAILNGASNVDLTLAYTRFEGLLIRLEAHDHHG